MEKLISADFELKDLEEKSSLIEMRRTFFSLIFEMKPKIIADLVGLYNKEKVPEELNEMVMFSNYFDRLGYFLVHNTKFLVHNTKKDFLPFTSSPLKEIYDTPLYNFCSYIDRNTGKIKHLENRIYDEGDYDKRMGRLVRKEAILEFLGEWESLKTKKNAKKLTNKISKWGRKYNLTDDWIYNFVLKVFTGIKVELLIPDFADTGVTKFPSEYRIMPFVNQLNSMWVITLNNDYKNYPDAQQWEFYANTYYEPFDFQFIDFEINETWYELSITREEFRHRVEEQLWKKFFDTYKNNPNELVGKTGEVKERLDIFLNNLDLYVYRIGEREKNKKTKTIDIRSGDKYFRWLVEYQVDSSTTMRKLELQNNVTRQTISNALKKTAELIKLTKRKSKIGRPKKKV